MSQRSYYYSESEQAPSIKVDMFSVSFEGDRALTSVWNRPPYLCWTNNTGFVFANFFGKHILISQDTENFFLSTYGPSFLQPSSMSSYNHCPSVGWQLIEHNDVLLRGTATSYASICNAYTVACRAPFAIEELLVRMMQFMVRMADKHALTVFLVCDSLQYLADNTLAPPQTAYVGVPSSEIRQWSSILQHVYETSTYWPEHHKDDSFLHLRYSRYSTTRMVIFAIDVTAGLKLKYGAYGWRAVKLPYLSSREHSLIFECVSCYKCVHAGKDDRWRGHLRNEHTGLCLAGNTLHACGSSIV
jgi:hypothetical protein